MDVTIIFNPTVTPIVIAGVIGVVLLTIVIMRREAIVKGLDQARLRLFTRAGFFWTVNLVFMAVSVLHAGAFFGITGNGHDLPGMGGYLGFAVSFFLDLVTVILMQAMLEARYRGEDGRARQFLLFIVICCGTSTFANLAISLNDFDAKTMLPHAPVWIATASPYVLASFPLFVIMMSVAAEMIVNVRPLESLNEEEYENDEKKRLRIIEIRNIYLEKQANEELRAATIRAQMRANRQMRRGNMPGGFRWFWEKPASVELLVAGVTAQLKAIYEPQIEALKRRLEELQDQQFQMNAPGVTAHLRAHSAKEVSPNTTDLSWAFMNQNETPIPFTANAFASGRSQDGYGDEMYQNSGSTNMANPFFWKNYPRVVSEWLANNRKTATLEEVIEVTGQTKRRLNKAPLRRSSRHPESILISSVLEWLKNAPLPANNSNGHTSDEASIEAFNQEHNGHVGQPKGTVSLEEYPEMPM